MNKQTAFALLLLGASLALTAALPGWRSQIPAPGFYEMAPEDFAQKVKSMVLAQATGRSEQDMPLVRPPEGDVYLLAERWRFYPALELERGKTYRLHVASLDGAHSLVLQGGERLLVPGLVEVVNITADKIGSLNPQCAEYCGLQHNRMKGFIEVVE